MRPTALQDKGKDPAGKKSATHHGMEGVGHNLPLNFFRFAKCVKTGKQINKA